MPNTFNLNKFTKGLNTRYDSFNIPHDAFSSLVNCFVYRGNVNSKFAAKLLCRAQVPETSSNLFSLNGSGGGSFNLLSVQPTTASVVLGSISLFDGVNTYIEPTTPNGTLVGTPSGTGTINYATGALTISGGNASGTVSGSYSIYTGLPILGFLTLSDNIQAPSFQIIMDQYYSYLYSGSGYGTATFNSTFQSSGTICQWNGDSSQLFIGCNYAQSIFVSNGNAGMQYGLITAITTGGATTITIANHGLVVNDYVWFNEINGVTSLNGVTAQVVAVTTNTFTVNVNTSSSPAYAGGGIAQYLTSNNSTSGDGIRYFYAGGWVNFAPPLFPFTVGGNQVRYLCGAQCIQAYKGRLIFFGVTTISSAGDLQLETGTLIYSAIGTPYYTTLNPTGIINAGAFYFFPVGVYGGFISFNSNDSIISATPWLDSILIELQSYKVRLLSTNSPTTPFIYEYVTFEYGGISKTASVTYNAGIISASSGAISSMGLVAAGFTQTSTAGSARIDDDVPDFGLSIDHFNNGYQKLITQRDYQAEIIYFTFPNARNTNLFPDTTFVYNYHDRTWAIWYESFCSYGTLFSLSGITWQDLTDPWYTYTNQWNAFGVGAYEIRYAAGNQQGYIFERDASSGSAESPSLSIAAISGSTFTIYNHNLEAGSPIVVTGAIGMTNLNGLVGTVASVTDTNTIVTSFEPSGTYLGGGQVTVIRPFFIRTKAFAFGLDHGKRMNVNTVRLMTNVTPEGIGPYSVVSLANMDISQAVNTQSVIYSPLILGSMSTAPSDPSGLNSSTKDQSFQWRRLSVNTSGFTFQLGIGMTIDQIALAQQSPFSLSAFSFDFELGGPYGD